MISDNRVLFDSSVTSTLPLFSLRCDSWSDNSLILRTVSLRLFSNSANLSLSSLDFFLAVEIFSLKSIFFVSISSGFCSRFIFSSSNFSILFSRIVICSAAISFLLFKSETFFLLSWIFSKFNLKSDKSLWASFNFFLKESIFPELFSNSFISSYISIKRFLCPNLSAADPGAPAATTKPSHLHKSPSFDTILCPYVSLEESFSPSDLFTKPVWLSLSFKTSEPWTNSESGLQPDGRFWDLSLIDSFFQCISFLVSKEWYNSSPSKASNAFSKPGLTSRFSIRELVASTLSPIIPSKASFSA